MRKSKLIAVSFILVAALLFAVAPATAGPVNVQFVGLGGQSQNGVYTFPYYLTINGGQPIAMLCDDFYDHIGVGDHWTANIYQLTAADMPFTKFDNLEEYQEAAYLLMQIQPGNSFDWPNINWAIWKIFDPNADPGAQYQEGVDFWLNKAESADLSKVNFSNVRILTPTGTVGQEFMYLTPEPGTMFLLGSGLLGIWARRKYQA